MKKKLIKAGRKVECLIEGTLIASFIYIAVVKRAFWGINEKRNTRSN